MAAPAAATSSPAMRPDSLFTFSTLRNGSVKPTRQYYLFYSNLYNLARTLALFFSDIVRELVAAMWQLIRNERPRIRRFGVYPFVRAATTSILRELNTFTIAGDMLRGVPSMYTTYVAYDEVAHHSGILRGDALRVLRQIDRDIGRLARVAEEAPRPYHLIVLSDHGQTQGATFRQRYGQTLGEIVSKAIQQHPDGEHPQVLQEDDPNDEGWGILNALITDFLRRDTSDHPVMRRALRHRMRDGEVTLRSDDRRGARNRSPRAGQTGCWSSPRAILASSRSPTPRAASPWKRSAAYTPT